MFRFTPLTSLQGKDYFFVQSWLGTLVLFLIQGVPFALGSLRSSLNLIPVTLQARLYALYQGSNRILALLVFGYVCEIAAVLTILGLLDADAQCMSFYILPPFIHAHEFMGYLFETQSQMRFRQGHISVLTSRAHRFIDHTSFGCL